MLYMKPQLVTTSTEGKRCHGKFTRANFGATATSKKETGREPATLSEVLKVLQKVFQSVNSSRIALDQAQARRYTVE